MKVLIDTNVVLDVLCNREEFYESSSQILKYCELKKIQGYVSALSFPNIVYIMRKELKPDKVKAVINSLTMILSIVDLKGEDIKKAANLDFNDYEDALQSLSASSIKADYIVTRNIKDFKCSVIPAIKPSELLDRL